MISLFAVITIKKRKKKMSIIIIVLNFALWRDILNGKGRRGVGGFEENREGWLKVSKTPNHRPPEFCCYSYHPIQLQDVTSFHRCFSVIFLCLNLMRLLLPVRRDVYFLSHLFSTSSKAYTRQFPRKCLFEILLEG